MRFLFNYVFLTAVLLLPSDPVRAYELELIPRIQLVTPAITLEPPVTAWLKQNQIVDVGIWGKSRPPLYQGVIQGRLEGVVADYLVMLQHILEIKFRLHYYDDSNSAYAALQSGQIKMIAFCHAECSDKEDILPSESWLKDKLVVMTRSGEEKIRHSTHVTGVMPNILPSPQGSTDAMPRRYFEQYTIALNALSLGQIDELRINRSSAEYLSRYYHYSNLQWAPERPEIDMSSSFGVSRNFPLLQTAINSALRQIPLISRQRIAEGWGLGLDAVMTSNPLGLDPHEEQWIKQNQKITLILSNNNLPVSKLDSSGKAEGLIPDTLNLIKERFGLNFDLKFYSDANGLASLKKRFPQALVGNEWLLDTDTQALGHAEQNSVTLLYSPLVVIMQAAVQKPETFDRLKGEQLASLSNDHLSAWSETEYPSIRMVQNNNIAALLSLLKQQTVRGIILPQFLANYMISTDDRSSFQIATTVPVNPSRLVLYSLLPQSFPLKIFQKALTSLSPESQIEIAAPWYRNEAPEDTKPVTVAWPLTAKIASGTFIALILFMWFYRLNNLVKKGRKTEHNLKDQLNFTETLIEQSPVALYARGRDGRLIRANQAWRDMLNIHDDRLMGKTILDINIMDSEAVLKLNEQYRQALKGQPQRWSGCYRIGDSRHTLEGWTVPWRNGQGEIAGLIGGWVDVSDRAALTEELELARAELEQVLASKYAFMQRMGHEVRTPLNAIIGLLEIELQSPGQSPSKSENFQLIWQSACDLLMLTGDMFDIFRADERALRGMIRSVNVEQLLRSTVALYQLQADQKNIEIAVETELKTERFDINSLVFIRIFSSLLRNAIKHSSEKKVSVTLYQGRAEDADERIPLVIEVSNGGVRFQETLTQDITSSEQLKKAYSETGFTLKECSQMATENGFDILIETDPDEGTTVGYYFSATASAVARQEQAQAGDAGLTVLIADDYAPGRHALKQWLQNNGFIVHEATQGNEALKLWRQYGDKLDLIITDCSMPELDGYGLTQAIRKTEASQERKAIPIFGLTALTESDAAEQCLAAGMNEYLIKPLSHVRFQSLLTRYFPACDSVVATTDNPTVDASLLTEIMEINQLDALALQESLNCADFAKTAHLAHRLCGTAAVIHDEDFYRSCKALELVCKPPYETSDIIRLAEEVLFKITEVNKKIIQPK